jgi:hypothetical protein
MRNTPTDLKILEYIFDNYYEQYINFVPEKRQRTDRIYVPLDLQEIATHFKIDLNILFGRLYYHLDHQYGYQKDNVHVPFFRNEANGEVYDLQTKEMVKKREVDLIHFPYLAAVIANLREEKKRYLTTTWVAIVSVAISLLAIFISSR